MIAAVFERATAKYGNRGIQYAFQESGHVSENIFLQATALGLARVVMGAIQEDEVQKVILARRNERPLCLQPIGIESK